ncbi:MAG TPA: bifunctional fucokinase/fucose-1-phosphate guanylyltransferase [Chthonomonadales bacterium]|nr:bifunctional fucokinase/fucose-1-phosphate guanylyltransferase [Chthonomonadales bacterium]
MREDAPPIEMLLSLPPRAAGVFGAVAPHLSGWFGAADPPGARLGSGGGAAHLLAKAWQSSGACGFPEWLARSRKLIVQGGGQSRRLPAYAALGKPLLPLPALRGAVGQRLDQTLLDLQAPSYRRVLEQAPEGACALVASGDVILSFADALPPIPAADLVILGMGVGPETAQHFGVCFIRRDRPGELDFFLQKPSSERIRELAITHEFLIDSGMWLMSGRAAELLMLRSGWDAAAQDFGPAGPRAFELYASLGPSLGASPAVRDGEVAGLTSAVASLPEAEFYHLGTSRQLIESVWTLQNRSDRRSFLPAVTQHPDQITQNAHIRAALHRTRNHTLWIENACVGAGWRLAHDHVVTGVPDNDWSLALPAGACLDVALVEGGLMCVRPYGIDDAFRGAAGDERTLWMGRPVAAWFAARGIDMTQAGVDPASDLQRAPLFPALPPGEIDEGLVTWMVAQSPDPCDPAAARWLSARRLSAADIAETADLAADAALRDCRRRQTARALHENRDASVFLHLDLHAAAALFVQEPPEESPPPADPLLAASEHMWRSEVLRRRGDDAGAESSERAAFESLRRAVLEEAHAAPADPVLSVQADQIVWARAPVRLDLAGGWTDTPPYCLRHGGRVVNVAVDLNGQPPIQVFLRPCERPHVVVRSIDLGVESRIETYEQLDTFAQPGSEFALAKAALALCGFLPTYDATGGQPTLERRLRAFGAGIEMSLLAAVPQGSGLGTSSILGATLLGGLADFCGLAWDRQTISRRTLALEQMLTTGGGWQDQVGGIMRGVKLIQTEPGLDQTVTLRWLPEHCLSGPEASRSVLLYYTGLTRLAKNILQEIVRGMFLNEASRLAIIREIGRNADRAADAIQRGSLPDLAAAVRRSWRLNRDLDPGTNPPGVQRILDQCGDDLAAAKLLGAGGGGYLLLFARDEDAGLRIRRTLTAGPPNERARFVGMSVSATGLEVTRS